MAHLLTRLVIPLAAAATACALLPRVDEIEVQEGLAGTQSTQPSAAGPAASVTSASVTATPGLLVQGHVHLTDGIALQGVVICRSFASYPGRQVAISGSQGEFSAEFVAIPGDEMVTVWPYLEGYSFEPAQVYWRHHHGFEVSELEFSASPMEPNAAPSVGCP